MTQWRRGKKNGQVVGNVPRSLAHYTLFFLPDKGTRLCVRLLAACGVGLELEVLCFYHFDGHQNFKRMLQDSLKK